MNTWNVHRMFITYIHRTQESRNTKNTYDFLVQVWNFLLPLSLKVLRHKERDTHSFYSGFFIYPHPTRVAPATRPLRASESHSSSSDRKTQLTDLFQNPQNPPRALPVHDVIHISWSNVGFLFWHLWMTHPPRACASTPALMLHLTNPCAKRKILSLTKPKGKIYETKSLGHYITQTNKEPRKSRIIRTTRTRKSYRLGLVVSWKLEPLHIMHCFTLYVFWKSYNIVKFGKWCFTSSN